MMGAVVADEAGIKTAGPERSLTISVIIPTYNEAAMIGRLLRYLQETAGPEIQEVILCDGGSTDGTVETARQYGVRVIRAARKGRAPQMNEGAQAAQGSLLYFLHADTFPPPLFCWRIMEAAEKGYRAGCFRLSFDYPHWFLKVNCWFTRFNLYPFRFGDQSLFVEREVFLQSGGFRNDMIVLEDQELVRRLARMTPFRVLKQSVVSSARKYRENGVYRTQLVYYFIYLLYVLGCSQQKMVATYRSLIRQDKV